MLARLGLTPYAFRATTAYYWSFTALGVSQIALGPALPFLADQMQVSLAQVSLLATARAAGFPAIATASSRSRIAASAPAWNTFSAMRA